MNKKSHGWLLVSGTGVGWLIGLSASPVLSIVVTGIIGALAGLTGVLAGVEHVPGDTASHSRQYRDPVPIAMLIVGITIGSIIGVSARTHAWLSPNVDQVISKWTTPPIALDRTEVARRMFDQFYPLPAPLGGRGAAAENGKSTSSGPPASATVLYAASDDECARFRTKDGEELRAELKSSVTSTSAREFANRVGDPTALKEAVSLFICPTH